MFKFDKDILIPKINLWLDSKRVRDFGFISHAHADHIARHKKIICSPPTADLLKFRLRETSINPLPFAETLQTDNYKISFHPAGHILGSAQIRLQVDGASLLYTGDFKLSPSRTAESFQPINADILIMETTFGHEKYKFPPRDEAEHNLINLCRQKLKAGVTPVVFAYNLGKGQEALKILTDAGLPVAADYQIIKYVRIYEKYGVRFGEYEKYKPSETSGKILLLPSGFRFRKKIKNIVSAYTVFLSGWGMDERARNRFGVDEVIPISDHADYQELLEAVKMISPKEIYCTHGSKAFVYTLRDAGYKAFQLETMHQLELDLV